MKENEEKNSSSIQNVKAKDKDKNEELHYKKIKIKPIKKEYINNYKQINNFENSNR